MAYHNPQLGTYMTYDKADYSGPWFMNPGLTLAICCCKNGGWFAGQVIVKNTEIGGNDILSGKRLHNDGKSPFLMGKSTISMAIFNSYL